MTPVGPIKLSRSRAKSLCMQARDGIERLARGLKAGDKLPRERDLAHTWGVSRITIRNAYALLVQEGKVMKTHKAYRMAPRLADTGLFMLDGFTRDAIARGHQPRTEVLGIELVYPEKSIAAALLLNPKERVYRLARKRFLNNAPIAVEYAHVSERLAPRLDTHPLESLYATLKKHYNLVVAWAEESLSICTEPIAEHDMLGLDHMCPLLRLRRVSFSRRNIPIEFVLACYNVRDFEFHLELRR